MDLMIAMRNVSKRAPVALLLGVAWAFLLGVAESQQNGADDRFRQATALLQQGKLQEAESGFRDVVRLSPTFAEAHFNLGLTLEELGKFEEAADNFRTALKLRPQLRGANLFLGVALYRLNQMDPAKKSIERETTLNPKDPGAWMWLGVVQLAQGKAEEAARSLDKAAGLAPTNPDILYHRGRAHLLVSRNSYEAMFKADPDSWRVHQVLAQAFVEAERDKEAIAEYELAIKKVPNQPGLHEELGNEYRKVSEMDAAEEAFTRELEIDPHNVLARYKLGSLKTERGKPAEGKALIAEALQENPGLPDAYYYLGRAEMGLGNYEAALSAFQKAVAADSDPEIVQQAYYQLAVVYRRLHKGAEAQQALATFQKLKQEASEHQQQLFEKKRQAQQEERPDPEQINQ